jgi:arylsulfatase A-like enzyme
VPRAPVSTRAASTNTPTACLSAQIAFAAATATAIGLLDAALVVSGIGGARGAFQFVPARIWVAAPFVWSIVAIPACAAILPFMRRWGGVASSALLCVAFLAIRLRTRPALLCVALAVLAVLLAMTARSILRWMARPRRTAAAAVIGALSASVIIAAAQPPVSAAEPVHQAKTGPNVIVIFLDTVRYDAVFDAERRVHEDLPTLARLRRESTTFTRAYATSSWTLPSHLSAVTGLPAHALGVSFDTQVYDRPDQTLAERFRRRGYRTAAVISNSFLNAGSGFARGFDTFQQAQAALDICRTAPGLMADTYWPWFSAAICNWTASEVTRRARALMDDERGPFFLTLNYMDAHEPYYVERSCGQDQGYRAAVRCLDRHLAPIVDWRSPRRSTMLAIVGDHGEQFGEHGLRRHGNSLYAQVLHVPLMIRAGDGSHTGQHAGPVSIAALPSLLDDMNTALAEEPVLAVLHPPAAANLPSQWSAIDASWHLIVRERGADALYHVPTDPAEERDVLSTAASDPAVLRLRASIDRIRRTPKPSLRDFRSLGYIH